MRTKEHIWLTTGQAARLCSVTPDTVLKWIRKGRLEAVRTAGGHYRVRREELDPFLTDQQPSEQIPPPDEQAVSQPLRCWDYLSSGGVLREECKQCQVYRVRASWCFRMAMAGVDVSTSCRFRHNSCDDCAYYRRVQGLPTNVLVVTSDHDLIRHLTRYETESLALRFAHNAYQASALVQDFLPAFAVVDQETLPPDDNGLLQSLSQDPRLPGLKIIVAAPRGTTPTVGNGRFGEFVVRVIEKPFGLRHIAAVIQSFPVEAAEPDPLPIQAHA
jgi:excisionase family DNA binding protein